MISLRIGRFGHVICAVLCVLAFVTSCGFGTDSPAEHDERLEKAAGVSEFRIVCSQRLWEQTIETDRTHNDEDLSEIEPVPLEGDMGERGLVEIRLNGPQLVDYLRRLDYDAHPGDWEGGADPLAVRMYDALAPVVDSIQPGTRPTQVPEVIVDDAAGASTSPSPSGGEPAAEASEPA